MISTVRTFSRSILALIAIAGSAPAVVVDFEGLTVPPAGFFNGNTGSLSPGQSVSTPWTDGGVAFSNTFGIDNFGGFDYDWWEGFSYSNIVNTTDPAFSNQYAAYPGGGYQSSTYAVPHTEYNDYKPAVTLPVPTTVSGFRIANTTYAALTMRDGDQYGFSAPLPSGGWFATTAIGRLGATTTGSATFFLADLRGASPPGILATWEWFDLSSLGMVDRIEFEFSGSDTGPFGLNTPRYFALDDLTVATVPEPTFSVLLASVAIAMLIRRHRTSGHA